jgi:molybdopterin synthase catalytic subunit
MMNEIKFIQGAVNSNHIDKLYELDYNNISGAQILFTGKVRPDAINGKAVSSIEFTAYEPMVEEQFKILVEEIRRQFDILSITLLHSLGNVLVNELCMAVFVSSAHREVAYQASKAFVDKIKNDLPIWGKEFFETGEHQWKNNT